MRHLILIAFAVVFLSVQIACWEGSNQWNHGAERRGLGWWHKKRASHAKPASSENDIPSNPPEKKKKYSVCRTKECFKIASELWDNMDRFVDPCNDFYQYACGGWTTRHPVPPTEKMWDANQMLQLQVHNRIRDLLEEDVHADDIVAVKIAKKYYQSCMNTDLREERGMQPIESIISRSGGWPMIMEKFEWNEEEYTWQQVDEFYTRQTSEFAMFKLGSRNNYEIDLIELTIIRPDLPLYNPEDNLNRSALYKSDNYATLIKAVAMELANSINSDVTESSMQKDIEDMIEFEKQLYDDSSESEEYPSMRIEDFQKLYDKETKLSRKAKINWMQKIADLYSEFGAKFDTARPITIGRNYFLGLGGILEKTPKRTIVNYIHWCHISRLLKHTTHKMQMLQFEIRKQFLGVKEPNPRWKTCVEEVKLQHAIAYLFVKKYFTKNMKIDSEKMMTNLRSSMTKMILKADWLDDSTRKSMVQKVRKMNAKIGYPEWYGNTKEMHSRHTGMVIGNQWLDNVFSYRKYAVKKEFSVVGQTYDNDRDEGWYDMDPVTVNAMYSPSENRLNLPAAHFFSPFYDPAHTDTLNWGALGVVFGHEMSHGFDSEGHEFDKNGDFKSWSRKQEAKYDERQKCFVEQFDSYSKQEAEAKNETYESHGEWTLAENIADSLGTEAMLNAFDDLLEEKDVPRLPGFENFTNDQMFFLAMANSWCESSTTEYDENAMNDPHSQAKYRVIAPVQNSENFARAYNCPKGSPMNPKIKCKVW